MTMNALENQEIRNNPNSDPILFLRDLAANHHPRLAVPESGSRQDFTLWIDQVREKVYDLLGMDRMQTAPVEIAEFSRTWEDGIQRERFYLKSEPGYWAPVIINIPDGTPPYPTVLCLHGHVSNGKDGVSGLAKNTPYLDNIASTPFYDRDAANKEWAQYVYYDTYAADLTRRGYLTVSLDNRDFNQALHPIPYTSNDYGWHVSHIVWLNALGRSYAGCGVWDAMRLIDFVLQREDVIASRLGCIGFSLGGLLTLYLSLLDLRVKAAVISGYFDSLLDRIVRGNGADCLCNYIPDMFTWFDVPDLVAALAPLPLLCNLDGSTPTPLFQKVQQVYDKVNADQNCELFQYEAPYHIFNGERAYPWLDQHLMADI
jgi:hypothetical protein